MACARALLLALVVATACGGRSGLLALPLQDAAHDAPTRDRAPAPDALLDPRCPPSRPEIGDACSPVTLLCHYERCLSEGKSDLTFVCVGDETPGRLGLQDRWDCAPNPAGCPPQPPVDLSPCSLPGAICRWAPGSKAHCWGSELRWHLWHPGAPQK